jgi:hypothetical protein
VLSPTSAAVAAVASSSVAVRLEAARAAAAETKRRILEAKKAKE